MSGFLALAEFLRLVYVNVKNFENRLYKVVYGFSVFPILQKQQMKNSAAFFIFFLQNLKPRANQTCPV